MDYEIMMNDNLKIGMSAPDFEANSSFGAIKLSDYKGKWLVFFSHPGDFTPVCTTEIIAFSKAYTYFEKINTCLLGISVDSNPSHLAWIYDIYCKTGIKVPFPIISDLNGTIARKYGMISSNISTTETVRNVFIIDNSGVIRAILIYPMNVGRFIPEILRLVTALQYGDENKASTPANWNPSDFMIDTSPKTISEVHSKIEALNQNHNGMSWYLSFKPNTTNLLNSKTKDNIKSAENH